ncbi:MAG TPA: DUF3857 and transglutaminase domain-containing protein [Kofleriaceae bacterium]
MKKLLWTLALVAACKGHSDDKAAAPKVVVADDPWAKKAAPKVDASKDPDLAQMSELAQNLLADKDYPQADALIAVERDDFTLKPDGTVVHHAKTIVKLLDAQRAKEKFADVHLPFDGTRQNLTIDKARTVNSDGEAHAASPEEIGDIVPAYLAGATIYSDVRERVVSLPAVDKGSVVELEWTKTSKPGPDSAMGAEVLLGTWDPILDRTVTITAPAGTIPKFAVSGIDLKPTEADTADGHTWTYHLAKQPDRHPEQGQLADPAVLPRLVIGFQPSWAKVLEPVAARFIDKAIPNPLPPEVKQLADQIVAGATTPEAKAQKLFAYVAHEIRSVDVPLGGAGYEPHPPATVLANRYADARDKVGLLLALASAEGIQGRPVLVRSGQVPVIQSVPTLAQFDHIVAKLAVGSAEVWLNPSDENGQYDFVIAGQDNLVLPLEKNGAELGKRPASDPAKSIAKTTAKFKLAANGDLEGNYVYELTGAFAERASTELRPLKGESLDKFFQHAAGELSALAVDKGHEVSDTLAVAGGMQVKQNVTVPGYAMAQGNFRNFELPPVTLSLADDVPNAGLSKRTTPMWIGAPRTTSGDITVDVPAGWKIAYVPEKLEGTADGVTYSSSCQAQGQTVTCHDEIKLDKLALEASQYGAFHDAIAKLQAYERRVVLLTKA